MNNNDLGRVGCAETGSREPSPAVSALTGFDPARGDVVITKDVFDFLMGAAPYDGVWFHEFNDNLPGRFWWRAVLRSAQLATASAIETRSAETGTGSVHESAIGDSRGAQPPTKEPTP